MSKKSISIIIPACNEEQGIESAVLHNIETFKALDFDFEVIIVNDKSEDRTGEIAESLASRYPNIKVFHHDSNQGSGAAFKTGVAWARKDYVVFVPIDNPLDIEDLQAYLFRLDVCDIVVGVRIQRVGYSSFALFASFVYNRIFIPLFFNIGLEDANWISFYRRDLFTSGIISFNSKSIFWLVEILIRARRRRLIIVEVPSKMKKRMHGRATCTRPQVMIQTFIEMIKFFRMIRKEDRRR